MDGGTPYWRSTAPHVSDKEYRVNSLVEARQQAQLAFEASGANLVVGNVLACPLPPAELATLTAAHPAVVTTYEGGLTAQVFHLRLQGRDYTLKQKRPQARVQNIDGQTSFLNEVQRRADFTRLKADPAWAPRLRAIVSTLYADYRQGIILSPWIPGAPLARFDAAVASQILQTVLACEQAGIQEWDLCAGNLLDDGEGIHLFDFGYTYLFDPLGGFNSNGLSDPLFHPCERLETRFFSGWLLQQALPAPLAIAHFRTLKQVAFDCYRAHRHWLVTSGAVPAVVARIDRLLLTWQQALLDETALARLYCCDLFRAHVLDIEDDLHGKSCTPLTLRRVEAVCAALRSDFAVLQAGEALIYALHGRSQADLLAHYQQVREQVLAYQL